jgi:hypothetical protein
MASRYKIIESHGEELALFQTPETNTAQLNVEEHLFRPVSQIGASSSYLEFHVPGNNSNYVDLSKTRLHVRLRIVKENGTDIGEDDQVALVNLPLQSIFNQVDVSLNQVPVCKLPQPLYSYKSYVDTLMRNGEEPKETQLQSQLWFGDTPGHMDNAKPTGMDEDSGANAGLANRWAFTVNSKLVDLEGSLHVDIFNQPRYLLNGVSLHIKLWQASNPFRLMASGNDPGYKVQIVDATLKITTVSVRPEIILAHNEALKKMPALYPYYKSDFRVFSVSQGNMNFMTDNMWNGECPSKAVIFLVSARAFNGAYDRNPYNLKHCNVTYISFTVDGVSKCGVLQPDFERDTYVECYLSMFTSTNNYGKDTGCDISRWAYKRGYTFYVVDVDGHHAKDYLPMPKKGHTRLELKFDRPLEESVNVLVYGLFPATLQIDQARNVIP